MKKILLFLSAVLLALLAPAYARAEAPCCYVKANNAHYVWRSGHCHGNNA